MLFERIKNNRGRPWHNAWPMKRKPTADDEVALLLDEVEQGDKLTDKQKNYHAKTKTRDLALLTLLLGTGIRVSECVGLNISDIDFKNGGIRIYRAARR